MEGSHLERKSFYTKCRMKDLAVVRWTILIYLLRYAKDTINKADHVSGFFAGNLIHARNLPIDFLLIAKKRGDCFVKGCCLMVTELSFTAYSAQICQSFLNRVLHPTNILHPKNHTSCERNARSLFRGTASIWCRSNSECEDLAIRFFIWLLICSISATFLV